MELEDWFWFTGLIFSMWGSIQGDKGLMIIGIFLVSIALGMMGYDFFKTILQRRGERR